jgi:hypothetical protein
MSRILLLSTSVIKGSRISEKALPIQGLRRVYLQAVSEPSDEGFSHLLSDLQNDFYLQRQDDVYRFHTKVLRDWWIRFYGFE